MTNDQNTENTENTENVPGKDPGNSSPEEWTKPLPAETQAEIRDRLNDQFTPTEAEETE